MSLDSLLADFDPACLSEEAEALRLEVRAFISEELPRYSPAQRAKSWMAWDPDFSRKLSARGWVGLTIPTRYGGGGLSHFHRFIVNEELLAAGLPVGAHWIGDRQSAPLLIRFGTEAQRERFLPAIVRSDSFFCIGMSEPGAGSDLAAVRSRAQRDGTGWRLKGRKIWTTGGHRADFMIALMRTSGSPDDRQRGLSQFLIDLRTPGITVTPIRLTTGEAEFAEVLFEDVWVPDEALVGEEGNGWSQVNAELAFERSGPERFYSSMPLLEFWARSAADPGSDLHMDQLGRWVADLVTLRSMSIALTARLAAGGSPTVGAALVKDMGTAFEQEVPTRLLGMMSGAVLADELREALAVTHQLAPSFSIRGGTREILRGTIARGLGLR